MDSRAIDKGKSLLKLKDIAKKMASTRDAATESQFISCLDAISTNHKMMIDIQTDIDWLCDITQLLCDLCEKSRSPDELLNAWLRFIERIPSQTKYTVFLVMDITEFRKCARLFFAVESKPVQTQIVDVLCSYLDCNKQKITHWMKQLFYCDILDNDLKQLSLYSVGKMDSITYKRHLIQLINKHANSPIRNSEQQARYSERIEDASNGIAQSTFYEVPPKQHQHKNDSQKWVLIHSSDDEDIQDQNNNAFAFETSVSMKPNAKSIRSSHSTHSAIQPEGSQRSTELLANQRKNGVEYKSNRKRRSAQIATALTKSQLTNEVNDADEVNDVYDFDEDDIEPVLKKKRRSVQPKKRKKPEAWPRIKKEEKNEKDRSTKVYTVRVKTPVGAQAKMNESKRPTDVSSSSVEAAEFLENGIEFSVNTLPNKDNTSVSSANVFKISDCPVKLPKKIIENIKKINDAAKIEHSTVTQSQHKCQSKDIVVVGLSKKVESKKKPRPRKLYSETESEFDGMDMDQADALKDRINQRAERILNSSSSLSDSIDEVITNETSVSIRINATFSSHTSVTKSKTDHDTSNGNSSAMPDSTNKPIVAHSDVMPLSTDMEIDTGNASRDYNLHRYHPKHREIVEQLKIASDALCRILSVLNSQDCQCINNTST